MPLYSFCTVSSYTNTPISISAIAQNNEATVTVSMLGDTTVISLPQGLVAPPAPVGPLVIFCMTPKVMSTKYVNISGGLIGNSAATSITANAMLFQR